MALLVSSEGLRPSDSPTRALARRFVGSLRSRGSLAALASRPHAKRFIRCVLVRGLATAAIVLVAWQLSARAQGATIEDEVKAAFLYNFTKYVDWPAAAFQDASDPFRMCVAGSPKFFRTVETLISGEKAHGRPIQLVAPEPSNLHRCHILFTGAEEASRYDASFPALSQRPILTVWESKIMFDRGGAILLVLDDSRVRFDVDVRSIEKAGLTVSAKLLRVARNVRGDGR